MSKSKAAQKLGSRGGKIGGVVRALKLSAETRKRIAQRAARKRWHKGKGPLDIEATRAEIERQYSEAVEKAVIERRAALDAIEYLCDKIDNPLPADKESLAEMLKRAKRDEILATLRGGGS